MPHELEEGVGGLGTMFSVRLTPWHKWGHVLNEAPTLEEGMRLAGHNYDVALTRIWVKGDQPVHVPGGDPPVPAYVSPDGYRAVVRTDKNRVLAVVGTTYKPIQNLDVFALLNPLLDKGVAKLETGGTLREGREAWMLVAFEVNDPVVQEVFTDEVKPFGLLTADHSGKGSASLGETPIRVVCANTLTTAVSASRRRITVPHRGEAGVRLVEAAEKMYAGLADRYKAIAMDFKLLKETRLTVAGFEKLVLNVAAPMPKKVDGRGGQVMLNRAMAMRDQIGQAWRRGTGHKADDSAWEAFNGLVEVVDHDETGFRTRRPRVEAMVGRFATLKATVFDGLLDAIEKGDAALVRR